jgi:hypothetical protein
MGFSTCNTATVSSALFSSSEVQEVGLVSIILSVLWTQAQQQKPSQTPSPVPFKAGDMLVPQVLMTSIGITSPPCNLTPTDLA